MNENTVNQQAEVTTGIEINTQPDWYHDEMYLGEIVVHRRMGTNRFEGFEFSTKESILVDEGNEVDTDLFRVEKHFDPRLGENSIFVMVANSEEYCVHEDATYFFDAEKIYEECIRQYYEGDVLEDSAEFREYALDEGEWDEHVDKIVYRPRCATPGYVESFPILLEKPMREEF